MPRGMLSNREHYWLVGINDQLSTPEEYGALILAGTIALHVKQKKMTNVTFLLYVLSIATIVWGAITGTWFGMEIPVLKDNNIAIMTMAPGGFFVFGCLMALVNKITKGKHKKKAGCEGCPMAEACGAIKVEEEAA